MQVEVVQLSHANAPRGESPEAIALDMENPLGAILIFGAIAVIAAFKRSLVDGIKVLVFCLAVFLLVFFFPHVGMVMLGLLATIFGIGLFWSMM